MNIQIMNANPGGGTPTCNWRLKFFEIVNGVNTNTVAFDRVMRISDTVTINFPLYTPGALEYRVQVELLDNPTAQRSYEIRNWNPMWDTTYSSGQFLLSAPINTPEFVDTHPGIGQNIIGSVGANIPSIRLYSYGGATPSIIPVPGIPVVNSSSPMTLGAPISLTMPSNTPNVLVYNNGVYVSTISNVPTNTTYTPSALGNYTFKGGNSYGESSADSSLVVVSAISVPVITSPATTTIGTPITGTVSGAGTVSVYANGSQVATIPISASTSFTYTPTQAGNYDTTFTPSGSSSVSASSSTVAVSAISVPLNAPYLNPSTGYLGDSINISLPSVSSTAVGTLGILNLRTNVLIQIPITGSKYIFTPKDIGNYDIFYTASTGAVTPTSVLTIEDSVAWLLPLLEENSRFLVELFK